MSCILEVKNLIKYFPVERGILRKTRSFVKAIDGISFCVEKADTLGIVGKSGAGKTTLAKLLLKLIPPSSGEIIYDSLEITNFRRDVQIIFQNPYQSLNPKMKIWNILMEPLKIHYHIRSRRENEKRVLESLRNVGLEPDVLTRFPIEFSGGQRQRICIARALILNPKFLVLDEPVSSLDLTRQVEILDLLIQLKQTFNFTYVFITHNVALLKEIADNIMVIDNGKIV